MLNSEASQWKYEEMTVTKNDIPYSDAIFRYFDMASSSPTASGEPDETAMISYLGRFNYSFKGKYLLTGTFRRDGSSKFKEGNRWGDFYSVALAYRISEEEFF
ncbi:MAG: TonB-dependent receptor [Bacteroidales bacterium]|nr:TonB-dependent receptor [Bacteroidales bacterium]